MQQQTAQSLKTDIDFSELFRHSPIAIYTCDKDGHVSSFNQAAAELWGRSPEIGKDLWCGSMKIFYPDGRPMPLDECPMALTLKTGKAHDGREIVIERPDHSFRTLLVYPRPLFDEFNELAGAHNTLVDISSYRSNDVKDAILSAIVESSDDAIISKNLNGIITSWNKGAQKIFGYEDHEIIGKSIYLLIPSELQSEEEVIIRNIKAGNKVDHFQTTRLTKYGKRISISLTVSPVKDSKGKIIGASKIARDIGEQLQLFEQVRTLSAKKDEFIALASHELKTPLTTIKGYLQLLQRDEQDNTRNRFFERSLEQVNRLNMLVSDLFDISKIESGKLLFTYESFDMEQVLAEILETFHHTGKHAVIMNSGGGPFIIEADKQRIEQVINNLLTNASKYSPDVDKIFIELTGGEKELTIKIKDEGIGLNKEEQTKIFDRFYRVEADTNITGLGLGLYISKEIITRHNGEISVISEPGKGSTFVVTLPVKKA